MAETDVQIHLTKIKLELKRLLQSAVAILEKVQGQNPTSWDQLNMMTAAESSGLDEMIQNYVMILESSPAALGINTNFQYKVSIESENVKTVDGETLVDTNHITKKWIDVTTGQEVAATPNMQALAEAIQNNLSKPDFYVVLSLLSPQGYIHLDLVVLMSIIPNLVSHLEYFGEAMNEIERFNFEKDQIEVVLERAQNLLRAVANDLTGNEETQESKLVKKDSEE